MDKDTLWKIIDTTWNDSIVEQLTEFIKIPNKSPLFDPDWETHGYMEQAVTLITRWCKQQPITNMTVEVMRLPKRTPLIYIDIKGQSDEPVILYGHLDKQPEMSGWSEGLHPWQPVLRDGKLYGRGAADDGYAVFSALTAIAALQDQNIPHARCVLIIEACEESGSYDLPFYLEKLQPKIGIPDLVIGLDSGSDNYEQLFNTTSLRGAFNGDLTIKILKQGMHSGMASGAVPSTFRILRLLLDRIEDSKTGEIKLPECHSPIPPKRIAHAKQLATVLGKKAFSAYPLLKEGKTITDDISELLLNVTWRPTLCVLGAEGLPAIANAGNVLRPKTAVKLGFRLPPTCNPEKAANAVKQCLENDPPYGATVTFTINEVGAGWEAPELAPWLEKSCEEASLAFFNKSAIYRGEGGSIPFMGLLNKHYPKAQFLITGVLGPQSNAHGPNEFLHIDYAKKITACVAYVLADHYKNKHSRGS